MTELMIQMQQQEADEEAVFVGVAQPRSSVCTNVWCLFLLHILRPPHTHAVYRETSLRLHAGL